MTTFLLFIFVLLITVLVHEWGHFWTARKFGMLVEEFGFGIPPRLYAWKKGETTYSINALPFGGFVKIAGENGEEVGKDPTKQFESKPWYAQAAVLVAGVVCNIILAIVLLTISYSIGTPTISEQGTPTIIGITKGGASESAGIKIGDILVSAKKNDVETSIGSTDELRALIKNEATPVELTISRDGKEQVFSITPLKGEGESALIGLGVEKVAVERVSIGKAFILATERTWIVAKSIFQVIGSLIASLFGGEKVEGLVGPIGIAQEVRYASDIGFTYLLSFIALISINLAVLNILPFPALDGGRLLIVLLEALTRKKFSKTAVGLIHTVGFFVLIALMLILSVKDVKDLF